MIAGSSGKPSYCRITAIFLGVKSYLKNIHDLHYIFSARRERVGTFAWTLGWRTFRCFLDFISIYVCFLHKILIRVSFSLKISQTFSLLTIYLSSRSLLTKYFCFRFLRHVVLRNIELRVHDSGNLSARKQRTTTPLRAWELSFQGGLAKFTFHLLVAST